MDKSMQDRIAKVAYELYEKRGRKDGHQEEDWLEAERLIKAQVAKEKSMKMAQDTRVAAQKVAARKVASKETKKKLTKPKPPTKTAAMSKRKKISPEATT